MPNLDKVINGSPYGSYTYSYPHKSAYRTFESPIPLNEIWAGESLDSLFLYLHVPFCEFRCGFCNLFTVANAEDEWVTRYLAQLRSEAAALKEHLPIAQYSRVAIGGGTPTYLDASQLLELLSIASDVLGCVKSVVPTSCEASPATMTDEKAQLLREWGVDRLSLGVQSFDDREANSLGRPQSIQNVQRAIDSVRRAGFPILNLDLIYGSCEQSYESWVTTVRKAIRLEAEEIYLYPLYVRELTGLGRTGASPGDDRLAHYRVGRDELVDAGYEQVSMRMFRKPNPAAANEPVYCCQSDGMIGLGCGARSYTQEVHYSSEFAVGREGVRSILGSYLRRSPESFSYAYHGYRLNCEEKRRRFLLQGLLQMEGMSTKGYQDQFGSNAIEDFPGLIDLLDNGLAELADEQMKLTDAGIERSDAIGPWLYSSEVIERMEAFECV